MLSIEYVPIKDIKPYERNAKLHPEDQVEQIKKSILAFGFNDPLALWHGEIVEGHGRFLAAQELGMKELPVIRLDNLTDEQRRAYMLAHNKLTMNSGFDLDLLNKELEELSFDMGDFGFDVDDEEVENKVVEDDFDATEILKKEPKTKKGDLYLLGTHRLLCGSATDKADVDRLVGDTVVDLLFTDPPYNIDYTGKTSEHLKIKNDKMKKEDFAEFLKDAFLLSASKLKKGGSFYIWHHDAFVVDFRAACEASSLDVKEELIWTKNSLILGMKDYQYKHEPCLYGWKKGAPHHFYADRKQTTLLDENFPVLVITNEEGTFLHIYNEKGNVVLRVPSYEIIEKCSSLLYFDKPRQSIDHPTMKPVGLCAYLIKNSTLEKEVVLDPFGGSGSTLMACEQLGRSCFTMELEPRYCDVIVARWEEFTGKKAVLISN